ncbi:MAG: aromatic amino acid lyase [bacterium]|nr:aromatic amino acid lyase [bacterium]MCP5069889.1 aromatic amino acid lyase [bacterium]
MALWQDEGYRRRLRMGQQAVRSRLAEGNPVYGVTTGVGASVGNSIPQALQQEMPHQLLRFHGCGTGRILEQEEAAAVLVVRTASLARGHSGVSETLLERLCLALEHRLLPRIPAEGSVGASGDLTPLSYLAAMLIGEREATLGGRLLSANAAWAELGVEPIRLGPKESLALMNGTSMMAALGCLVWEQGQKLARLAAAITAIVSEVCHGNPDHFDARIFSWKPHPGTEQAAAWIREDLERDDALRRDRLQDRYSIRCAPHVLGVLLDAASFAKELLEVEVNGVNDNPLVDPEQGDVLHGGNFYGGHVALAMDTLKTAIASVADLLDRQLTLLCCPETSGGLPENLVAQTGDGALVHHGFKAMQISASALTAEALKLTMPAAAFSRSTESHNQDKVSMGTIAARDGLRIAELTETVGSIAVLAACQAVDLRERDGQAPGRRAGLLRDAIRKVVPGLEQDRRQDDDIARVLDLHRTGNTGLEP